MEIVIRENTLLNELKGLLEKIDPGYDALTSMAIKQPGQGSEDKIRTSNVYQIEVGNPAAFEMKCRLDEILQAARGELQFVLNSTDRFLDGKRSLEAKEIESLKRHLVKKAKSF